MDKVIIHGHPKDCESQLYELSKKYTTCIMGMTGYGKEDKIAIVVDIYVKPTLSKDTIKELTEPTIEDKSPG